MQRPLLDLGRELTHTREDGSTITGPCTATSEVWCTTADRGDIDKTLCRVNQEHCDKFRQFAISPSGLGCSDAQVAACTQLDQSFQPAE